MITREQIKELLRLNVKVNDDRIQIEGKIGLSSKITLMGTDAEEYKKDRVNGKENAKDELANMIYVTLKSKETFALLNQGKI